MFENIGWGELLLIIIILIVFFGPKRIPDIAQSIGKGIREFRKATRDIQDQVTQAVNEEPRPKPAEPKQVQQPLPGQEMKSDSNSKTETKS